MGISTIGYVIPEFPGQTHSWMWREIMQMRQWGVDLKIFSTRRPDTATRARHTFADDDQSETFYLWPTSPLRMLASVG